jgi:hypothetical protein
MYEEVESILKELIKMSENILSSDDLEGVLHYLDHGEYEMSFEGLVIEFYTTRKYPTNFNYEKWKELAISFGLDKESVFDERFWDKFNEWGVAYSTKR